MISHFTVRKFIPVFSRTTQKAVFKSVYTFPTGYEVVKSFETVARYTKGDDNLFEVRKTSKPKTLWAIVRVRIKRVGQKNFFGNLFGEKIR